jgi:hypothetical protein
MKENKKKIKKAAVQHANIVSDPEWEDFHGRELSYRLGAYYGFSLAAEREEQIRAEAWNSVIDFLMHNAGNYCTCGPNDDGLWCDKHAQTFAAVILKDEAERRGINL